MQSGPPIIIKRVKKGGAGHHGGAWKVAFADFATAMMAFFLVLWLSASTSKEQKEAIEGYFKDPVGFTEGGAPNPIDLQGSATISESPDQATTEPVPITEQKVKDLADELEKKQLQAMKQNLLDQIEESPTLQPFKDQLLIDITEDGLRIQIVDRSKRPMFDSGKAELKYYSEDILFELAKTFDTVPNKIKITGHTDAQPFIGRDGYSNWELSSDRANAARRALVAGGVNETKLAEVVGLGSSVLFDPKNPTAPINRRIGIIVLNKAAASAVERTAGGFKGEVDAPADDLPVPQQKARESLDNGTWFDEVKEVKPDEVTW